MGIKDFLIYLNFSVLWGILFLASLVKNRIFAIFLGYYMNKISSNVALISKQFPPIKLIFPFFQESLYYERPQPDVDSETL